MSVASKEKLLKKLRNREYRNAYAEESVKTSLPFQIRAIREQRDWSQAILGRKMEMKQNAISRLESPDYGNLSVNTLLRAANAFDCGLLVKFVPFSKLLREFENVSPDGLRADEFEDDMSALEAWANIATLDSSVLVSEGDTGDFIGGAELFTERSVPDSDFSDSQWGTTLQFCFIDSTKEGITEYA